MIDPVLGEGEVDGAAAEARIGVSRHAGDQEGVDEHPEPRQQWSGQLGKDVGLRALFRMLIDRGCPQPEQPQDA